MRLDSALCLVHPVACVAILRGMAGVLCLESRYFFFSVFSRLCVTTACSYFSAWGCFGVVLCFFCFCFSFIVFVPRFRLRKKRTPRFYIIETVDGTLFVGFHEHGLLCMRNNGAGM